MDTVGDRFYEIIVLHLQSIALAVVRWWLREVRFFEFSCAEKNGKHYTTQMHFSSISHHADYLVISGWYFLILIVLEALALCMTVFIVHLQHRGVEGQPVPSCLKSFCCIRKKKASSLSQRKPLDLVVPNGLKLLEKRVYNNHQTSKKAKVSKV